MGNNINTSKQLISIIQNTEWIDLSIGHKQLRIDIENSIENVCVNKNALPPIMIKGAFGIGKTATLHYLFHYAWIQLGVPTFFVNLEDLIAEIKIYLLNNNLKKLPNADVSKVLGEVLNKQIDILRNSEVESINGGEIYFPSFNIGNLEEYLSRFIPARIHTTDNGEFKDRDFDVFDIKVIKEAIGRDTKYLLLIDEFETKYQELKQLIESSGGGNLRQLFDDVASISSTNFYCIIGNGPASGYELNQDVKERSDDVAAQQGRLSLMQINMATVSSLSKSFLKGYEKEHINFIWWLSRVRPRQIKKLKMNLQPLDELAGHNYIQFLKENKVLDEVLDESVGDSSVKFLKTEIFEYLSINVKDMIKDLLIKLGPHRLAITDEIIQKELAEHKELFYVGNGTVHVSEIIEALQEDILAIRDSSKIYSQVNFNSMHVYIDLILNSISNQENKIAFGVINKDVDKYLSKTFLTPLLSDLYEFNKIYEDEHDKNIKLLLDFILDLIFKSENEDIDTLFPACYDLFDEGSVKFKRVDEVDIQLSLYAIRESIEQPIGSPKLPYKAESLEVKISDVDAIENIFVWNKSDNEEIIIIPDYDDDLLQSYLESLVAHIHENWNDNKNYFGNGKLVTNIVYLENNERITNFIKSICYLEEEKVLPFLLKRFNVCQIDSYLIHNAKHISDFISSIAKIATVGIQCGDIDANDLKGSKDHEEDSIIRIDKLIDIILKAEWTESKQIRRTIEYYKDLLLTGEKCAFNQISLTANEQYDNEIESYVHSIERSKQSSYSLKLSDKDHLEIVYSNASRRFISFSLAQSESIDNSFQKILFSIQELQLYPEDQKEDLSLVSYYTFTKMYKKELSRFIDDFHGTDRTFKGIKRYIELLSSHSQPISMEDIISLHHQDELLQKSYLSHVGVSYYKNYYYDGLYLNAISDKIDDLEDFEIKIKSDLDDQKAELRELSIELLELSENLIVLAGKKDFIIYNEIDKYYSNVIIPYIRYYDEHPSVSNAILGKEIHNSIGIKIILIRDFISSVKLLEESLQGYYDIINEKQLEVNELYDDDQLKALLFKEKYAVARNGNYLYKKIFVESFKRLGGGEAYDRIFQEKYKPTSKFWIKSEDIELFKSTLQAAYDGNISMIDEIIVNLKSISEDVDNVRGIEKKISSLIASDENE
jgi:hypothetical protein